MVSYILLDLFLHKKPQRYAKETALPPITSFDPDRLQDYYVDFDEMQYRDMVVGSKRGGSPHSRAQVVSVLPRSVLPAISEADWLVGNSHIFENRNQPIRPRCVPPGDITVLNNCAFTIFRKAMSQSVTTTHKIVRNVFLISIFLQLKMNVFACEEHLHRHKLCCTFYVSCPSTRPHEARLSYKVHSRYCAFHPYTVHLHARTCHGTRYPRTVFMADPAVSRKVHRSYCACHQII